MSNSTPGRSEVEKLKVNEQKWSKPLMEAGWTALPNVIIERQAALGLDALDINLIVHLAHYWWQPENLPRPSVETIAKALQVTPRTIQKRMRQLEAAGLMNREERRTTKNGSATNLYRFDGLIKAATPFAVEKLKEIEAATKAKTERLARKRPKLVVNNEGGGVG